MKILPEIHYGLLSEPPFVSYVSVSPFEHFVNEYRYQVKISVTNEAENSKPPVTVVL